MQPSLLRLVSVGRPRCESSRPKGQSAGCSKVVISGEIDTGKLGEQILYYDFTSDRGKEAVSLKRVVTVVDTTPPVITLTGGEGDKCWGRF